MAACINCYLFDKYKLDAKIVFFFLKRQDMLIFLLNTILNIKKYFLDHCKCDEEICSVCKISDIFPEDVSYELYKKCFDLDF